MGGEEVAHTCPRRMNEYGPWAREPGLDTYEADHGLVGQLRGCSFCGSLPPDDFMEAVKTGARIEPTDKGYKLYLSWDNPEPDVLHPVTASSGGQESRRLGGYTYLAWDEMTPEQYEEAHKLFGRGGGRERYTEIGFGPRAKINSKFYTTHLSPEQGREFAKLWQDGKVNWGEPGGPYRPLYLPGASEDAAAAKKAAQQN